MREQQVTCVTNTRLFPRMNETVKAENQYLEQHDQTLQKWCIERLVLVY